MFKKLWTQLKKWSRENEILFYGIVFLFLISLTWGYSIYVQNSNSLDEIQKSISEKLHLKEKKADAILSNLSKYFDSSEKDENLKNNIAFESFQKEATAFFVFKNKKLSFWSDNSVPIYDVSIDSINKSSFLFISNGWYDVRKIIQNGNTYVSLILVKHKYPYQNEYLQNDLPDEFDITQDLLVNSKRSNNSIFSIENKYLFSIEALTNSPSKGQLLIFGFLFLMSMILGFQLILKMLISIKRLKVRPFLLLIVFGFIVAMIRSIMFYYTFPDFLYDSEFFSPKYYASSELLPSLGDLFINSVLFLYLGNIFFQYRFQIKNHLYLNKIARWIIGFLIIGLLIFSFEFIFGLFNSIVINSDIPLNLNLIFNINEMSLVALIIMAFMLLGYYFLFYRIIKIAISLTRIEILLLSIPMGLIMCYLYHEDNIIILFLLLISLFGWIWFTEFKIKFKRLVNHAGFLILFGSIFSTIAINSSNYQKEKEKRKILAIQITKEHDPIAEFLFKDIEEKSQSDKTLKLLVSQYPYSENHIISYLESHYFNGFWSKYRIQITICKPQQFLLVQPTNENVNCRAYFSDKIEKLGVPTLTDNLYFISYGAGYNSYLASIEIPSIIKGDSLSTQIFIEMDPKSSMKELGYPELLIDKAVKLNNEISNYSYGLYNNGELIKNVGKYFYMTQLSSYTHSKTGFFFFNNNGYNHLYFNINQKQDVIISKKQDGFIDVMASFSYLLLFYVIFFSLFYLVFHIPFQRWNFDINFKGRLQLSLVGIILASFIVIGLLILFYILNLNDNKNQEVLSEKMNSIQIELENKFAVFDSLQNEMKPFMNSELNRLSSTFFTDINLFDTQGRLFSSSRPKVFEERLISTLMNHEAVNQLIINQKAIYIQQENIGDLKYMSAYIPFRNDRNQLMGYLNLPYFARESDLKKEISAFIVAFINIYVLLLAIAIIIAVIVSSYITRPLQTIKNKIGRLSLGKQNEKINWKRKDEIGGLVGEYNRMIDELSSSAELLAKSERESAWREMAKQVAHEIKNPLTPIKLSVQYLQKAWNDKTPDFDEKLKKFTQTLVEQIDSLSAIATSFSDFAIMPQAKHERVNIATVINNAIEIYGDKNEVQLRFENTILTDGNTLADKQQLLRVFNNILKNAFQALEDTQNGRIEIIMKEEGNEYIIAIIDNGKGISESQREKIFVPNFTTKSYGMGLGLAMTKNIIQSFDGRIWFESIENKETTFYIALPMYN